ncbi:hypothetical protein Q3G72_000441 [Acer saccharum]|nr:hypothetical protein Q3G72_000441 [Acer saccharum]
MAQEYLIDKYRSGFYGSQPSSKHNSINFGAGNIIRFFPTSGQMITLSKKRFMCTSLNSNYNPKGTSVVEYHRNLTNDKLQVLLYSGDVDMSIPYIGTEQWIMSLNLTLNESWRAWSVDDQLAGVVVTSLLSTELRSVLPWFIGGFLTILFDYCSNCRNSIPCYNCTNKD